MPPPPPPPNTPTTNEQDTNTGAAPGRGDRCRARPRALLDVYEAARPAGDACGPEKVDGGRLRRGQPPTTFAGKAARPVPNPEGLFRMVIASDLHPRPRALPPASPDLLPGAERGLARLAHCNSTLPHPP